MTIKREFHRHPITIPLQVQSVSRSRENAIIEAVYTKNVSLGGLAFTSEQPWPQGHILQLHINASPPFTFMGKVVWCKPLAPTADEPQPRYDIGVEFMAKRANMLDELVRIENYYKLF
jgi:hypothetical protein